MMSYDFGEADLAHVRKIVFHLEHSTERSRVLASVAVISLNYWRARVRAILATPLLPIHVEKQAIDLLGRLDRLEDPRRRAKTP